MTILDAAFWVVCLVLVAAGATKLIDPEPLADALRGLRRTDRPTGRRTDRQTTVSTTGTGAGAALEPGSSAATTIARVVGLVEVVLGVGGLAVGGAVVAIGVASAYVAFALIVGAAIRRALPSCGCFGARSGPPSAAHVVVNVLSAAVAVAAAVTVVPAMADGLEGLGAGAVAVVVGVLAATAAVIVVDTRVGGATVARHTDRRGDR